MIPIPNYSPKIYIKVRIVTIRTIFFTNHGHQTTPISIPAPYPDIPATIDPINVRAIIKINPTVSKDAINFSSIVIISCIKQKDFVILQII